jgi:hypothetical protein
VEAWAAACRGDAPPVAPSFDQWRVRLPSGEELTRTMGTKEIFILELETHTFLCFFSSTTSEEVMLAHPLCKMQSRRIRRILYLFNTFQYVGLLGHCGHESFMGSFVVF